MVKSMNLSSAKFFIAVLAAFYLGRSCTVLAPSFRGTLGCQKQDRSRSYPQAVWTFIVRPRQYLSSVRALSLNIKRAKVLNSLALHQPLKILLSDLLVGEKGFGDVRPLSRFTQRCPSLMSMSLHLPGRCTGL